MWNIFRRKKKNRPISFKESLDLTELPIITFVNNKQKLNFIFDTGATKSMIDSNVIDNLKYQNSSDITITTGIGGKSKAMNTIIMELKYKDSDFVETFQLMDMSHVVRAIKEETGVSIHGLLGNTFFQEYGYIIDYNDFVVYNKK